MSNILVAFASLVEETKVEVEEFYTGSNRANNMGESLENYVKDLFSGSFLLDRDAAHKKHQEVFSYLGNKNNPPDAILKDGDAIEVKKIESLKSGLALNSSYPKHKLYGDSPLILASCKDVDGGEWKEKDIIYVVGVVRENCLRGLWFVYGDCYAANKDVYERIANSVIAGINSNDSIELAKTNELARVNRVDPLGITYLRVRGMWGIDNPVNVFSYLNLELSEKFFSHVIMRKSKFDSFSLEDKKKLNELSMSNDRLKIMDEEITNPDNPALKLEAVILSYTL